jgi:hypothetical protein
MQTKLLKLYRKTSDGQYYTCMRQPLMCSECSYDCVTNSDVEKCPEQLPALAILNPCNVREENQDTTWLPTAWERTAMRGTPSWEANRFWVSQEILRILWGPKVYNYIHMFLPPVPNLSQLGPVHTPTSHFLSNVWKNYSTCIVVLHRVRPNRCAKTDLSLFLIKMLATKLWAIPVHRLRW